MNDTSRKPWLAWSARVGVVVLILAVGLGITFILQTTAPSSDSTAPVSALPQVKVFAAQQVELRRQWEGFGNARALDSADVPARVAATVMTKPKTILPGTPIRFGEKIVELDSSDYDKQLTIAQQRLDDLNAQLKALDIEEASLKDRIAIEEKELEIANNEYRRVKEVYKNDAGNPRELDTARQGVLRAERALLQSHELLDKFAPRRLQWNAAYHAQEQQRDLAQLNVNRCKITSPIDGVIQSIDVEEGENVMVGQRVARVVNLSKVEVAVQLPAASRSQVIVGSPIELHSSNNNALICEAKVKRISPEDDFSTRTMTAYVEVDQTDRAKQPNPSADPQFISPGQFLSAVAESSHVESRWVVPRRSIRTGRIMVVEKGVVLSRIVSIDYLAEKDLEAQFRLPDDQWAVLVNNSEPLKAGELVIVNASIAVRDGDKVEPVLPGEETGPSTGATTRKPDADAKEAQP